MTHVFTYSIIGYLIDAVEWDVGVNGNNAT